MLRRSILAVAVLAAPFVLDLAAKQLAISELIFGEAVPVFPGFNLTLLFNPGVSFGLFPVGSDTGLAFILFVQSALCLGIAVYAWMQRDKAIVWPMLLLLSGALANVVDRLLNGAVTDYLDFYIGAYHWPAFNLADVWITLGVAGLIAAEVFGSTPDKLTVERKG